MDAGFTQPLEVQRRLSDVYALLRSGRVYELDNPPAECEHDYGWVMGGAGFHEFAVIDGTGHTASLVVTCDD
ncbi:MAG: hypothetical protein QOE97_2733 [Pseudonocardiales bacterium]|nr:hypothetical protein [Pseudonocardiales bacterium]